MNLARFELALVPYKKICFFIKIRNSLFKPLRKRDHLSPNQLRG